MGLHSSAGSLHCTVNAEATGLHSSACRLHCSENAEDTDSNPFEAPKSFLFFRLIRNCLNCDSAAIVTYSFILYSRSSHNFILCYVSFFSRVDDLNKLAGFLSARFIAQQVEHCSAITEPTASNPVEAPKNLFSGYFATA